MSPSDSSFVLGANLPWVHYGCDFGANAWRPRGGLAAEPIPDVLLRTLDDLASLGTRVVRWFVFCDGRAGIRFAPDGSVIDLDAHVLVDLDAAVDVVARAGLRVMFVLFDFNWCHHRRYVNGVDVGGRRRILSDAALRQGLIDRVVVPVIERYRGHDAVWAWDIINEPEWVTFGVGRWNVFGSVSRRTMRAFIDDVTKVVQAQGTQPVTVGLASASGLPFLAGNTMDFYQVHWYDHLDRRARLERPVSALGVDRPVLLGEFPTRGSRYSPDEILRLAAGHGYSGGFFWSALATDRATDYASGARGLSAFAIEANDQRAAWS